MVFKNNNQMKIEIKDLLAEAQEQIKELAIASAKEYSATAIAAGNELLTSMKSDLERWTQMLANQQITQAEFDLLAKSYKTEIIIASLEQAGMATIKATELSLSILNTVIEVSIKFVNRLLESAV
jgi:hypothetical protein